MQKEENEDRNEDDNEVIINETVYALSDFRGVGENQVSFCKGDALNIIEKSTTDWWWVEISGCHGYAPVNHLSFASYQIQAWEDVEYFGQYGNLKIHHEMLSDKPRTLAYQTAIQNNADYLENKTVLDLGCGTGILSLMCAKYASPKKVYAVEASDMADYTKDVVECNGYSEIISVMRQYAEDIKLDEKVDMIISEWMGTVLLDMIRILTNKESPHILVFTFEMMIESVILARDRLLQDDGVIWPSLASLFLVPCSAADAYCEKASFWDEQYGFSFSPLKEVARTELLQKPIHCHEMKLEDGLSPAQELFTLVMKTVTVAEVEEILSNFDFVINQSATLHGFVSYFKVIFQGFCKDIEDVTLSTGPESPLTHWKHDLFLLDEPVEVKIDDVVNGVFILSRNKEWRRHLKVKLKFSIRRDNELISTVEKVFSIWR